ncbi:MULTISPECIES: type IV pilus modification PilV family protein [Pseudoalteromonas]|uniref:Prepilin-type N-terminal cleavage/methylation domain-containing protein n=1 Tax=Pseudoalteromonas haloplanktis TaxID=228 RepID=A0ABU1BDT5_PSEHA|nr:MULTISPECIES: prepilin-type N-terminal cleavage/methylation domain-containing protein [Pseudoalteromonas]MCF6144190.1 type IV pilus assembly protein PilV [Pseudoalteromonas mariniglutinosa NCIMB 1770]MDQ9092658.1 prepilin-type N-terminal cleavage/methylation domain-containing protein [Pseudoalteromonas haloplanktis]TMN69249.1 prepilin-type cleavage/methylation domain-containing protein [Pseudoalteromonas sp. S1727]
MNKQQGFSLLEVMLSVVIAGIALLGLAAAQLKSLQYATNSFNYTISLVQGQNTLERIWPRLCELQTTNPALFTDANFRASLGPQINDYQLTLPAAYAHDMQITVSWSDERIKQQDPAQLENQITLNASYPELPAGCI